MAGEGAVERVVVMTAGIVAGEEERRELVEREGRDVSDVLLPRRPEDLMELIRRSMVRPPRWMPEFLLMDFIELAALCHEMLKLNLCNSSDISLAKAKSSMSGGERILTATNLHELALVATANGSVVARGAAEVVRNKTPVSMKNEASEANMLETSKTTGEA
ncbi:uncharacterized protein LOC109839273 [Asparagus officinalis]|nr:uncharacterized protein LOC109839273 [Asparagus officinalis]